MLMGPPDSCKTLIPPTSHKYVPCWHLLLIILFSRPTSHMQSSRMDLVTYKSLSFVSPRPCSFQGEDLIPSKGPHFPSSPIPTSHLLWDLVPSFLFDPTSALSLLDSVGELNIPPFGIRIILRNSRPRRSSKNGMLTTCKGNAHLWRKSLPVRVSPVLYQEEKASPKSQETLTSGEGADSSLRDQLTLITGLALLTSP